MKDMEREANQFAMELLMPEQMVIDAVCNFHDGFDLTNDDDVQNLAERFVVPASAMAIRIHDLHDKISIELRKRAT